MRLTVEIDEGTLEQVMKFTGESKKGPAFVKADSEFVLRHLILEFARKVMEGEFSDYPLTNNEIEEFDR